MTPTGVEHFPYADSVKFPGDGEPIFDADRR